METFDIKTNWNGLEVDARDFFTTWEYSENFKDLFSTISAKTVKAICLKIYEITPEEAKKINDKYSRLHLKLISGEIKLDTQEKADKILDELVEVIKTIK